MSELGLPNRMIDLHHEMTPVPDPKRPRVLGNLGAHGLGPGGQRPRFIHSFAKIRKLLARESKDLVKREKLHTSC